MLGKRKEGRSGEGKAMKGWDGEQVQGREWFWPGRIKRRKDGKGEGEA